MTKNDRRGFIIHLIPEPDCTDPIKALRELLKRALRSWGLRCVALSEVNHDRDGPIDRPESEIAEPLPLWH
jgi:hypothetical protein